VLVWFWGCVSVGVCVKAGLGKLGMLQTLETSLHVHMW